MKKRILIAVLAAALLIGAVLTCFFVLRAKYREPLTDGFHLSEERIFLVQDGVRVTTPGAGSYQDIPYTCDENGLLTVTGVLQLADGGRCIAQDGSLCKARGFYEFEGSLYFVCEDGMLLCDAEQDTLQFGADGRYTSGNADIDAYVEKIISSETDSSMTQLQKLRAVYEYIYRHMTYQSNNNHVPRGDDPSLWTETYMLRLMERGKGNCYCFASEMYYLARRLGYPARAVSGGIGKKNGDHGWVEITIDGTVYLFDPEQDAKHYKSPGSLFMVTYENSPKQYWPPE